MRLSERLDSASVELLREMAEDGGATPVPAPMLAELCRTWLSVQAAPVATLSTQTGSIIVGSVADGTHVKGQRVRLVIEDAAMGRREGGGDGG